MANVAATNNTGLEVPHELIQIQAYVLWEEQGKPEGLVRSSLAGRFGRVRGTMEISLKPPEINPDLSQVGGQSLSKRQFI